MKTRAMIRHPLLVASLGAAVVALPASALYLYGSGHTAKAAGTSAVVASALYSSVAVTDTFILLWLIRVITLPTTWSSRRSIASGVRSSESSRRHLALL